MNIDWIIEDPGMALDRIQELEAENLRLQRKLNKIDDAVIALIFEVEDGSQPVDGINRISDILAGY